MRITRHINIRQARNTRPAILRAEELGLPLNRVVTINFTCQGIEDEIAITTILEKIRGRYCRWAKEPGKKRRAEPFIGTMMWFLENTGHIAAHLMMHVPSTRLINFKIELERWIAKYTNVEIQPDSLDVRNIYNPHGLRKYLLKGINPAIAKLYRVNAIPQGIILGKRMGFTKNLGPSQCIAHRKKRSYYAPNSVINQLRDS